MCRLLQRITCRPHYQNCDMANALYVLWPLAAVAVTAATAVLAMLAYHMRPPTHRPLANSCRRPTAYGRVASACGLWPMAQGRRPVPCALWPTAYGSAVYHLPDPINKTMNACGKNRTLPTYIINASDFPAALAAVPRWPLAMASALWVLWVIDHRHIGNVTRGP